MPTTFALGELSFRLQIIPQYRERIDALLNPFITTGNKENDAEFIVESVDKSISVKGARPLRNHFFMEYDPYRFALLDHQFELSVSLEKKSAKLSINAAAARPEALIFNSLKWFVTYIAQLHGLVPLHSSLVAQEGSGMLFCGASGAGKSTICQLLTSSATLMRRGSDELNLLGIHNGIPVVTPTPFVSSAGESQFGTQRQLRMVFFIGQANDHTIKPVNRSRLFHQLLRNCYVATENALCADRLLSTIELLSATIPAAELYFRNDRSICAFIQQEWGDGDAIAM